MSCANAYDTLTVSAGEALPNDYQDDLGYAVTSYCRVEDGTWIAWRRSIVGDQISTRSTAGFGDPDKTTWPSHIASAYAIVVGYFADDASAPVIYELGVDPVYVWQTSIPGGNDPCSLLPLFDDRYADFGHAHLVGWSMAPLDVQIRSDGSNVWVVALAAESLKYPFLYNAPTEIDKCGITHPTFEAYWASGHSDPFYHDSDAGHRWWLYTKGLLGGDKPFGAYDDPGFDQSFRWQPYRVTVWAGDLGGFSSIGTVEAEFANSSGLCSGIEVAASPSEPGLCHVLWAEAGDYGGTDDPHRGQRINYSRWDSSGLVLDADVRSAAESGSGYVSDANWVWTAEMILRNDHGSPIAIVWPWLTDGGPIAPSSAAEFWDLSGGTASVVQTLDPTLVPTATEAGTVDVPQVIGGLLAAPVLPRRQQFASSLYTDPLLTNTDVYLICVAYGENAFRTSAAFYRIPCDGSAGFDFLDGTREVGYSIVSGYSADPVGVTGDGTEFASDFVSDPDDIWMPFGSRVLRLDRQCRRGWEALDAFPGVGPSGLAGDWSTSTNQVTPPSLLPGDWLAGGGMIVPSTVLDVAALRAKICRCCEPCNRRGMHVWEII